MRKFLILAFVPLLLLAACGGAGVTGGGGGGGGTPPPTQTIATPGPPNVEALTMDTGPTGLNPPALNTAFVTINVCLPGTATCQSVDHIEVDTGSSGLRILSAALPAGFNLPPLMTMPNGGMTIAECLPFADGSSFGPVVTADLELPISTKKASNINVQLIGAAGYTLPSDCSTNTENTVDAFGANGILGVGPFLQDCGQACMQQIIPMAYYTCSGAAPQTCAGATVTLAHQVSNPVASFDDGMDNNGVIVELPSVAPGGAATLSGALVFGIGTQTNQNNALGSATVLPADGYGYVRASFNGQTGLFAALDSGSTLIYFTYAITKCAAPLSGLYCPNSTLGLTATLTGASGNPTKVASFNVQSGNILNTTPADFAAVPELGGPLNLVNAPPPPAEIIQFDLGMPFYFGQNVYTAIEGQSTPGGTGPYFAY